MINIDSLENSIPVERIIDNSSDISQNKNEEKIKNKREDKLKRKDENNEQYEKEDDLDLRLFLENDDFVNDLEISEKQYINSDTEDGNSESEEINTDFSFTVSYFKFIDEKDCFSVKFNDKTIKIYETVDENMNKKYFHKINDFEYAVNSANRINYFLIASYNYDTEIKKWLDFFIKKQVDLTNKKTLMGLIGKTKTVKQKLFFVELLSVLIEQDEIYENLK
jgi:hypothetical protein